MATEVDICNMALSFLGDRATVTSINPPEGSAQAEHCARFYPMALNEMLAQARWSFATKREKLVRFAEEVPGAAYAYAVPSDCLTIQSVHTTLEKYFGHSGLAKTWTVCRRGTMLALLTDESVEYICYTTSDVPAATMPPLFSLALAHLLASKIAGAMVTGPTGVELAQAQVKFYDLYLRRAMTEDAMSSNEDIEHEPPFFSTYCDGDLYGQL